MTGTSPGVFTLLPPKARKKALSAIRMVTTSQPPTRFYDDDSDTGKILITLPFRGGAVHEDPIWNIHIKHMTFI